MAGVVKRDLRAARRAETEARLVEAASDLFVAQAYAGTTLTQVADRAGVAERTVYVRVATKPDCCIAVSASPSRATPNRSTSPTATG
jgi:AcrR family transcriptional regulator